MQLNLNTFTQTNSSIYLIDENLCLKDSAEILNNNFKIWQSQIDEIASRISLCYDAIGYVIDNSSEWVIFLTLLDSLQDILPTAFKTVEEMPSWQRPVSITYPILIPITEWTTKIKKEYYYQNAIDWLNTHFPLESLNLNQIIKLNFQFQQEKNFRVHYEATYLENCIATPLNPIECDTTVGLYVGCNHYGGLAGESPACTNAYEPTGPQAHFCTSEYIAVAPSNNCWSTDPFLMKTEYSYYNTETITSKLVEVEFILKEGGWEIKT